MRHLVFGFMTLLLAASSPAAVHTETVQYQHGDTTLQGYLAYEETTTDKRPGVLVVHEWWGLNDYAKTRAEKLAELGVVAFAADIYGGGRMTDDAQEAGHLAGVFMQDRGLLRARAMAGLEILRNHPLVDADRLAAIGYCFGGTTVLEMARAGAPLRGVVSFHGGLKTPGPAEKGAVQAKILVLHGAEDPFVKREDMEVFQQEMRRADVDWQMVIYGGAQHGFTNPAAEGTLRGVRYHADADRRSWQHMRDFFAEVLE